MKRAEKRRPYRGRKPRRGFSGEQVIIFALLMLLAVMAMTIHANSSWTGMTAQEQLYRALFVAKDWD